MSINLSHHSPPRPPDAPDMVHRQCPATATSPVGAVRRCPRMDELPYMEVCATDVGTYLIRPTPPAGTKSSLPVHVHIIPPSRPFPSLHLAPVPKARLPRPARRTRLVDPRWTTLDHTRPTTPASSSFPRASSSRPRRRSISPCRPPSTARTLSLQSQTSLPMPAIRPHHTIPPSQPPHPPPSPPPPRPIPPGPHIAPPALARRCTPLVGETQNQRSSPICTPIVPTTSPQTPAILSCPAKTPRISTMVCHLPVISSRSSTSQCFLLPLGVRS